MDRGCPDNIKHSSMKKSAKKLNDIIGKTFGKLTVLSLYAKKNGQTYFNCLCICGIIKVANGYQLLYGRTTSCGDHKRGSDNPNFSHGLHGSKLYLVWKSMRQRCLNPNNKQYRNYGERGISICKEWMDYAAFYNWAICNNYADKLTIERINNDGNYEPLNCKWATHAEQAINKRRTRYLEYSGEVLPFTLMARKYGVHPT